MISPMLGVLDLWPVQVDVQPDVYDLIGAASAAAQAGFAFAALVVAGLAVKWAKKAAGHAKSAADAANDQAEASNVQAKASNELLALEMKRQQRADDAVIRAQAEQVAVWVDYDNRRVIIRNASLQPIFNVLLFAVPRGQVITKPLKKYEFIPPPSLNGGGTRLGFVPRLDGIDGEEWWSPPPDLVPISPGMSFADPGPVEAAMNERADSDPDQPEPRGAGVYVEIRFNDQAGKRWVRTVDGELVEEAAVLD